MNTGTADNYTVLGNSSKTLIKERLNEILESFVSRDEVNSLIDFFIQEPADVKTEIEKKIINKLVIGEKYTNYFKNHTKKPVIDYDKGDIYEVENAANEYRKYANMLPNNESYEQKIINILSEILQNCKTSGDHITRLVTQRINTLSPELKNENDSTRLLIFKQALKSLEFPKNSYFSRELTDYICDITGISRTSSSTDITKAISLLTDDANNAPTDVFNKLREIDFNISETKKDYDKFVSAYAKKNEEYKLVKKEYDTLTRSLSKEKTTIDKEIKKAEEEKKKAVKALDKLEQAVKRDKDILEKEENENKKKQIANRLSEANTQLENAICTLKEKETIFDEKSKKAENIENAYNNSTSNFNIIKNKYETLTAEKNDIAKKKDRAENKHKDLQKKYNKIWAPLIWADDIAKGFFNDQQTTRKKLYWFAIIFSLTFYSASLNEKENPDTDIQKNLFYDFYADNLLNNLLIDNSEDALKTEKEPSGHGINFKNYAEAIYLYYLSRHNMTPLDKIIAAEDMIERCKTKDNFIIDSQLQHHANKNTVLYENEMAELLSIDSDDKYSLYEYITANYVCGTTSNTTPTRVVSGNKTAAAVYQDLICGLKKAAIEIDQQIEHSDALSYIDNELECKSVAAKQMILLSLLVRDTITYVEDKSLKKLLEKIDEKFRCIWKKKSIEECIDSTFLPKNNAEDDVSRTRLIVLYYFLVGLEYLNEGTVFNDFESFYDEFCENKTIRIISSSSAVKEPFYAGLNSCLIAADYQEINPKNAFDIAVLFFAFKMFIDKN